MIRYITTLIRSARPSLLMRVVLIIIIAVAKVHVTCYENSLDCHEPNGINSVIITLCARRRVSVYNIHDVAYNTTVYTL